MYCKVCRCNPCKCSCIQSEAVCLVPAKPCVPGTPGIPGHPDIDYPLTLEKLLLLLKKKCDKTMCKAIQTEIDLLYALLGVDKPLPPGTLPPGGGVNPPVLPAFQLIANMVSNLNGDLTDKYPSAELLKAELMAIWKCMSHKQQHHGDWVDNWTYRTVIQSTNGCLIDGDKDPAPDKIKVITPVDVGSTVFAVIEGKKCLFESLVDNNITEPSKKSVLEGKWINYCDLKEVIDCVLPRKLITDCHALCDDPNGDGVHEDKTLCARVSCIEDQICNTDCVPGVPTICERLETLKGDEDHVTNFEFVNNPGSALDKYKITMKQGGTFQVPALSIKSFDLVGGDTYKITMTDGTVFTAACCASDKVTVVSDSHTFRAETKPGGVDLSKFDRIGSITIPAGTPRSLYQVNSSNQAYAHTSAATGVPPTATITTVASAYMGYRIKVNGVVKGRKAWSNDHDTMYKGNTADLVAHMSEQMILNGGDVITMEVEYGDHSVDQHLVAMAAFDFHADSAYIDVLQIKVI